MALLLGIESSCDEIATAVFDTTQQKILSNKLFSQIMLHQKFGGVVPELASRSHLEKIDEVITQGLETAEVTLDQLDAIAVTNKPGLAGSLLIGLCFAKGLAFAKQKKLVAVNHLEGHIFSCFLAPDGTVRTDLKFPFLSLSVSGGHTSFYLVKDFGVFEEIGHIIDDAAGEAFDKISRHMGLGYPGGPIIEKLAKQVGFKDFYNYPRTKQKATSLNFTFSGLKTAVLYDMVNRGLYDFSVGKIMDSCTLEEQQKIASSLLVCITDIFKAKIQLAFKQFPHVNGLALVGGVACNSFIKEELTMLCKKYNRFFVAPVPQFCTDNGAMIAFVGGYKFLKNEFAPLSLDVYE